MLYNANFYKPDSMYVTSEDSFYSPVYTNVQAVHEGGYSVSEPSQGYSGTQDGYICAPEGYQTRPTDFSTPVFCSPVTNFNPTPYYNNSPGFCIVPITEEQGFKNTPNQYQEVQHTDCGSPQTVPRFINQEQSSLQEQSFFRSQHLQDTWSPVSPGFRHNGITQRFRSRFQEEINRSSSPELKNTTGSVPSVFCTDQELANPIMALVCDVIVQNLLS